MSAKGRRQFVGKVGRAAVFSTASKLRNSPRGKKHPYGDDFPENAKLCKKAANYQCQAIKIGLPACSNRFPPPLSNLLHAHHVIPWIKSKDNRLSNLICLCLTCHEKHHRKTIAGGFQITEKQKRFAKQLR